MIFSNLVCTVHIQDSLSTPYSDAHHIRMQYKGWISSYLSYESTLFSHVDLLQSRKYVFIFKNWYDLFTNFYLWSEFGYDALMSQLNVIYPTILYTCIYSMNCCSTKNHRHRQTPFKYSTTECRKLQTYIYTKFIISVASWWTRTIIYQTNSTNIIPHHLCMYGVVVVKVVREA